MMGYASEAKAKALIQEHQSSEEAMFSCQWMLYSCLKEPEIGHLNSTVPATPACNTSMDQ